MLPRFYLDLLRRAAIVSKVFAIIPARGGSKGLVNKNILPLLGHPLI
ncbi:MAG: cytidylyltransferase domain-containing protein, partial [Actinomycetota bacterium]